MHELSVCLALMTQVERIAAEHDAERVRKITLRIGPLSGVEPALLGNAFPIASAGTTAEGAELLIETGPVTVRCSVCGTASDVSPNRLTCGTCGDYRTRVVSGEELLLLSLELDRSADARASGGDPQEAAAPL